MTTTQSLAAAVGLTMVTTWVVACEPRDVIVFQGDGGPGPASNGADVGVPGSGGYGGSDAGGNGGRTGGGPSSGGTTASGGAPGSGGAIGATGGTTGGGGPGNPSPCRRGSDCPTLATCKKQSCGSPGGICVPLPPSCPLDFDPYCGCDGITYWNDCVRLQNGVAASNQGACGPAGRPCGSSVDCGLPGATCAFLVPPGFQCGQPPGQCWVAPGDCSVTDDHRYWQRCEPPFPQPSGPCADTCTALNAQGAVFAPAPPNACP
jgi:hypothetical protein